MIGSNAPRNNQLEFLSLARMFERTINENDELRWCDGSREIRNQVTRNR